MLRSLIIVGLLLGISAAGVLAQNTTDDGKASSSATTEATTELERAAKQARGLLSDYMLPINTKRDGVQQNNALIDLGRMLYFDTRLSASGRFAL